MSSDIGIYGLSTRAINLALNFAAKGLSVSIGHRSSDLIKECTHQAEKKDLDEKITGKKDVNGFCDSLSSPKKVILMSKPGTSAEKNYSKILAALEEGDLLIDATSEGYEINLRREKEAAEKGVRFLTMEILGTTKELQKGCGFLLSGEREAYDLVEGPLKKAATEVEYEPCVAYIGNSVSAGYAGMALSSLGLGMEQLVAEAYHMLHEAGFTNEEVSKSINGWNKDSLASPFLENLLHILKKKDQDVEGCEKGEGSLLDKVLDCPLPRPDHSTLLREGFEHHAAIGALTAAVQEIAVSAKREERSKAATLWNGPEFDWQKLDHVQLIEDLRNTFVCGQLVLATQTFALLRRASEDFSWAMKLEEVGRVVAGAASFRSGLLVVLKESVENGDLSLLQNEAVSEILQKKQASWRRVAALAVIGGVSAPVATASLAYYDTMRRDKLPQNVVVAMRDFLEASSFERTDCARGMTYHCEWTKETN
ncbi:uncharacterized protein [Blastocystis hominis]|nr:uncharacterized protein [Blastocystis hominis]XP_012898202.1 uncharacterized protein [Blastocystis hominis]CBK19986.2 unnamed protein product [Blastocystis hominis]CBK24154.2 unnamed protein product [Blastocystis hominis]|eukprot:XP_012894034.1 uncharacterized protein [Blastocystis hominis]